MGSLHVCISPQWAAQHCQEYSACLSCAFVDSEARCAHFPRSAILRARLNLTRPKSHTWNSCSSQAGSDTRLSADRTASTAAQRSSPARPAPPSDCRWRRSKVHAPAALISSLPVSLGPACTSACSAHAFNLDAPTRGDHAQRYCSPARGAECLFLKLDTTMWSDLAHQPALPPVCMPPACWQLGGPGNSHRHMGRQLMSTK